MRLASALLWSTLVVAAPAHAENRTFIISTNADGYGVDRCLAAGESCGTAVATAYCRARDFDQALSFRKIARSEVGGIMAANARTCAGACDDLVAIECGR